MTLAKANDVVRRIGPLLQANSWRSAENKVQELHEVNLHIWDKSLEDDHQYEHKMASQVE